MAKKADKESELTDEQKIQLIAEVYDRPCLWNAADPQYKDNGAKEEAWRGISGSMELPVPTIRNQWNKLRQSYNRELNKLPSGSGTPQATKWQYFRLLTFLNTVVKPRKTVGNTEPPRAQETANENLDDVSDVGTSPTTVNETPNDPETPRSREPPAKRRTPAPSKTKDDLRNFVPQLLESMNKSETEEDLFGAQIAEGLKKLPFDLKIRVKNEVQATLGNAQIEAYNRQPTTSQQYQPMHEMQPARIFSPDQY